MRVLKGSTDNEHSRDEVVFYLLKDRVLYRKVKSDGQMRLLLLIPKMLRPNVLEEAQDNLFEGHSGIAHTYERIRQRHF